MLPKTFKTHEMEIGDPIGPKKRSFFDNIGRKHSRSEEMAHLWEKMGDVEKWIKAKQPKFVCRDIDALIEGLQDLKQKFPTE